MKRGDWWVYVVAVQRRKSGMAEGATSQGKTKGRTREGHCAHFPRDPCACKLKEKIETRFECSIKQTMQAIHNQPNVPIDSLLFFFSKPVQMQEKRVKVMRTRAGLLQSVRVCVCVCVRECASETECLIDAITSARVCARGHGVNSKATALELPTPAFPIFTAGRPLQRETRLVR